MMKIISGVYLLCMWIYGMGLRIASLFNEKARLLVQGRKETWIKLAEYDNTEPCIWVHAASLGEFEQGRPLIEAIKKANPKKKVVLTFYSPSGYEVRKNYNMADLVCYLPADGPQNAEGFIEAINPEMAYFVKYEFWHFFLTRLQRRGIPLYGVSMIFRRNQPFFSSWGDWFRDMLKCFNKIYVQDQKSADLLKCIGVTNTAVVGDTRFDRVAQIAQNAADVEIAKNFVVGAKHVMVAGSTWPPDEELLLPFVNSDATDCRLIIAPHETDKVRVDALCAKLTVPYTRFTEVQKGEAPKPNSKVLVIDTIGLLSAIYKYGDMAYVGGGFGVGIHNTLEPATFGIPVIFGPNHLKFKEAIDLKECGGGFGIKDKDEFDKVVKRLLNDTSALTTSGAAADSYCKSMCGATNAIMSETQGLSIQ